MRRPLGGRNETSRARARLTSPALSMNDSSADRRKGSRHWQQLIQQTKSLEPIRTAVVHPVDAESLLGAIEAAKAKLIVPVLVGPEAKIRAVADQIKVDISSYELVANGAQSRRGRPSRRTCV
jgi:hypothetical protein